MSKFILNATFSIRNRISQDLYEARHINEFDNFVVLRGKTHVGFKS